jgi:HD-GYP domain-containing protein (c-di-GMP phosphodiesterase class II)
MSGPLPADLAAAAVAEEANTRRAMLHILEDLQRERDAISVAHKQWINTVDAVRDPLVVHDAAGCVVRANRAYAERAGVDVREMIGRPYRECFPRLEAAFSPAGEPNSEQEFALESGEIFICRSFPVARGAGAGHTLRLFEDVTQRRASEHRIRSLNTLYATLSAVNHAIVQSKTRREICERIVRISTEIGLWHGAWIGFADPQTKRLVPEAWSPGMAPYMDKLATVSTDPALPEGQGPTGNAIRSNVPYFCNDVLTDPLTAPWVEFARASGTGSVAAIPLQVGGFPPGIVNLYSKEKDIFTPEVRALVVEMGDDITYALEMLETERQRTAAEAALLDHQQKLRRGLEATVEAIAATVETRDPYTAGHQRRVADLAKAIGREMGLPEPTLEGLHFGALIHDLGKVQVPAEILSKPTKLTKLEFELIKVHPQAGYDIIKNIEFPWPVAAMVHQHHERLDGSGYPQGLKGDAIALEARILAVADVVEAMASHRPYRAGLGIDAALKEIEAKRGIWFEPAAVDACLRLFREKQFVLA